jgi:hypothetical protein
VPGEAGDLPSGQLEPAGGSVTALSRLLLELLDLRNDRGATLPRVGQQPTLLALGGSWRRAGRSSADEDVVAARELLRSSIGDLGDRERDLLMAQFAFTHHHPSRERREAEYLKQLNGNGQPGSLSSFDRWSQVGMKQLAQRILDRTTGFRPSAPSVDLKDNVEEPFAFNMVQNVYRFNPGRLLRDMRSERHITSLTEGNHVYLTHNTLFDDLHDGVIEFEPEFGCRKVDEFVEGGVVYCLLEMSKTLAVGEEFRFSYRTHSRSLKPLASRIMHIASYDIGQFVLDIEFAEDAIPRDIARFADLPYFYANLRERRRRAVKPHNGSRYVREEWYGLRRGLSYGVDWDWSSDATDPA